LESVGDDDDDNVNEEMKLSMLFDGDSSKLDGVGDG